MEKLKKFEEICEPDSRQKGFVTLYQDGTVSPFSLERIYNNLENIKLHDGVPENLQDHFQMARNLYLYSWFYYPFNIAAQLYGFITVEFALRERLGDKSPIVFTPEGLKDHKKREKEEKKRRFGDG